MQNAPAPLWGTTTIQIPKGPSTLSVNEKWQGNDWDTPVAATLEGSNFRGLYNEYAGWHKPEYAAAKKVMQDSAYDFLVKYMPVPAQLDMKLQNTFESVQQGCVKLYTSTWEYGVKSQGLAKPVYNYINYAIYHDDYTQLKRFMPIIRMINSYLREDVNNDHTKPITVYRGFKVPQDTLNKFKQGEQCRFATYMSTSLKPEIAAQFAAWKAVDYLFEFQVPCHAEAPHFRTVKAVSMFPTEDEVVFVPYSKFSIVSLDGKMTVNNKEFKVIKLKALDNVNSNNPPCHVPTPFPDPIAQSPTTTTAPPVVIKKQGPKTHNFF